MEQFFGLLAANLASPVVLFFILGMGAALLRSDLEVPQAVAKALALYLMLAIGFKGGVEVAGHGPDFRLLASLLVGILLSFMIPIIAFALLQRFTPLERLDAAAVSAHYGSISIVTFAVATDRLVAGGIGYEGYLVAVAAAMESPAIASGIWLARRGAAAQTAGGGTSANANGSGSLLREVALNSSIVMLVGAFFIGWITGAEGFATVSPFIVDPFKGVLCLFLLDMGLIAGRGLRGGQRELGLPLIAFAIYMPLIGGALGALGAALLGLSAGGAALLITLSASASYIAVPAAMRLALPEAKPGIYLTLSLGVTFPFNISLGIPLYLTVGQWIA